MNAMWVSFILFGCTYILQIINGDEAGFITIVVAKWFVNLYIGECCMNLLKIIVALLTVWMSLACIMLLVISKTTLSRWQYGSWISNISGDKDEIFVLSSFVAVILFLKFWIIIVNLQFIEEIINFFYHRSTGGTIYARRLR